ncbi:MAG: efflux RND transporter periplasmic adaptor subunit [Gammaproteobacteria bacterium]|nr:efflux RND transporter periplasmic adaptor subunit [Gammaproteobacteria bacterium]
MSHRIGASIVLLLTIIVLLGLLVGITVGFNKPLPKKPLKTAEPYIEVIKPETERHRFLVTGHGVIMPRTETTLVSEVSGRVERVSDKFYVGGYFAAGEVLLNIDPTDYQVAVEQAKARLMSAKAQYAQEKARAEQAQKEWDLSGRSRSKAPSLALREPFLLEAEANVQSAQADLKKAEQKLQRTVIRAPYAGMIKEKRADIGQFVSVGTTLGVTFATDYAEVRIPLTDQDLAFIDEPNWQSPEVQPLPVTVSAEYAGQNHNWQGELVRMEGTVDSRSRVHYAVVRVDDPYGLQEGSAHNQPLKVGTFVTAVIQGIEMDNLVKVPREAFRDLSKVLVSDQDNKLYTRDVEIARAEDNFVYIRSGLQPGDNVVLTAIESPIQGMAVRTNLDQPAASSANEESVAQSKPVAVEQQ